MNTTFFLLKKCAPKNSEDEDCFEDDGKYKNSKAN